MCCFTVKCVLIMVLSSVYAITAWLLERIPFGLPAGVRDGLQNIFELKRIDWICWETMLFYFKNIKIIRVEI